MLGVGILGGVMIGQNTASAADASSRPGQAGFAGGPMPTDAAGGFGGANAMGGFTSGTVVSVDGATMIVESSDGTQVTVTTTDDTTVTATADTTLDTLAAGDTVTVIGEADDSGDVAATSVSEGAMTGFPGAGAGRPDDTETTGDSTD